MLLMCWGHYINKRGVELFCATRISGFWKQLSLDEVIELIKLDERYTTADCDWKPNVAYSKDQIVRMNHEVIEDKDQNGEMVNSGYSVSQQVQAH